VRHRVAGPSSNRLQQLRGHAHRATGAATGGRPGACGTTAWL